MQLGGKTNATPHSSASHNFSLVTSTVILISDEKISLEEAMIWSVIACLKILSVIFTKNYEMKRSGFFLQAFK